MQTRHTRLLLLLLFAGLSGQAQNLVPNPSFETLGPTPNCSWMVSQAQFTAGMMNWTLPSQGTSDVFNYALAQTCYANPASNSGSAAGQQHPHTGNGMCGIFTFGTGGVPSWREYLQVQLTSPLVTGQTYLGEFWVSLGDNSSLAANNLSMYFSTTSTNSGVSGPLNLVPQIVETNVITDTANWVLVSGTFVATAPWDYIIIGNEKDDASTLSQVVPTSGFINLAYYFVDDVYVGPAQGQLFLAGDTTLCLGDTTHLVASGDSNYHWALASNPGSFIDNDSLLVVNPATTTTYICYSAHDTAHITVHVFANPTVNLGPDTTYCGTVSGTLNAGAGNFVYTWEDNSGGQLHHISVPGTYFVSLVDAHGCKASDTIHVLLSNPAVNLGPDTLICYYDKVWLNAGSGFATYAWTNPSGTVLNTTASYLAGPGTYAVQVTDALGCQALDAINLLPQRPLVNLGPDTIACKETLLQLNAGTGFITYLWEDGTTLATSSVRGPGAYYVQVTDTLGCIGRDTLLALPGDCDQIALPNAFSPNQDGDNDLFFILNTDEFNLTLFRIYNRWGQLVFETNNKYAGWDGTFQGQRCEIGTYIYTVTGNTFAGKPVIKKGDVTLIR